MTRWLLIGDSHLEALAPRLAERLAPKGIEVRAIVRRGRGVTSFVDDPEVRRLVQTFRPNRTIILLGGNDGRGGDAEYRVRVRRLLRQVPKPLWVGPWYASDPGVQERHLRAGRLIAQVAESVGVPFIDGQELSVDAPLAPDGVHYTGRGYDQIAAKLADELARATARWWLLWGAVGVVALGAWWLLRTR